MNIPEGSVLLFTGGDSRVSVSGSRTVQLDGKDMSLTAATREVTSRFNGGDPTRLWTYNGQTLWDIYNDTYCCESRNPFSLQTEGARPDINSDPVQDVSSQGGRQGRGTLRIGTWNVYYAFQPRLPALRHVMVENEADIWVLTETHNDLTPSGCRYVAHSASRPRNHSGVRPGSRWVSIWSKHPIEKIECNLADPERTVVASADFGGRHKLIVYGTVLPWEGDRNIAGWSEHLRVINEQSVEWLTLRKEYPLNPICVAGDFNSGMDNGRRYGPKAGVLALKRGLVACGSACATEPSRLPKGLLSVLPIDHIALPIDWLPRSVVAAAWPADKSNTSDHSGVIVEVSV